MGEEKNKAYEVLGVSKNASREEIERRFTILLKKYRASSGSNGESRQVNIDRVTRAYNLLMGYEDENTDREAEEREKKSLRNFLHYHKVHIIVGIVVIALLVSFIKGIVTKEPVDLNIAFIGDFYYSETDVLKEDIKSGMPELRGISIDGAMLSDRLDGQQEYAMQMKAMTLFAAAEIDVYILDRNNFNRYATQGAFASLEEVFDQLEIDDSKKVLSKIEEQENEGIYGIDVSDSEIFNNWGMHAPEGEKIVAIGIRSKNYENAVGFIELLLH